MKKFDSVQELIRELVQAYYVDRDAARVLACVTEQIQWTSETA